MENVAGKWQPNSLWNCNEEILMWIRVPPFSLFITFKQFNYNGIKN